MATLMSDAQLAASRLGSLVSSAQSSELLIEMVAEMLLGVRGHQRVFLVLELYKAICRLRLLRLQPSGCLMRSLPPDDGTDGGSSFGRLGGGTKLSARAGAPVLGSGTAGQGHARWPRAVAAGASDESGPSIGSDLAQSALSLGELLHIAQPVVHLLLVQLMPESWRNTRRAWLPWLAALLIDAAALQLCITATSTPPQRESLGAVVRSLGRLSAASHSAGNLDELRHRRELAWLFLVRPASLAAVRLVLHRLSRRRAGDAPGALAQLIEQLIERERTCSHCFQTEVEQASTPQ